ncbi:MAG TPA: amidohydrolase [Bryobacteraceae bacterium]|nr:amidohydrolase [Bryobacteraceae bacterium]
MRSASVVLSLMIVWAGSGAGQTPSNQEIDAIYPAIDALYIDLHQNPELGFQEVETAAKLAARVRALGYEVTTGVARTGIVAVMKNGPGPTVMLRTELDALPIEEKTGLPFASRVVVRNASGQLTPVMHACGHDIHMAAWTGTATLMATHKDRWHGTLVLVGQPAEEGGGGAAAMLKDGLFTRFPRPDFALSLHDDDSMPAGTIGYHAGPFRAMSDPVTIVVYGRGGHAAMPMNTVDPVVLASRIVVALQTIVSRENNPVDPVVITVGSIHGGTQGNIVPDEVRLQLSVRTYTLEVRRKTLDAIRRIARGEAISAGAPREPEVTAPAEPGYPVVYNDPALTARLAKALKAGLGEKAVIEMPAKMTSEDFSEYWSIGNVPSALLHIGAAKFAEIQRTGIPGPAPHSPEWAPVREPTLKGAMRTEVTELMELLGK